MRIGIDFDNTLACYDTVFAQESQKLGFTTYAAHITKQDIKAKLLSRPDGILLWQTLQGRVYGPSMAKAHLFPGVASFLIRSLQRGYDLFIVSHKTEFGHFDPTQTSLRQAAIDWMEYQGFFDPSRFGLAKDHVFFAHTREEKISHIASLNLDLFIDDLEEVFIQECFPPIKKILFNTGPHIGCAATQLESWAAIAQHILGPVTDIETKALAQTLCPEPIGTMNQLERSGNSTLYRVESVNGIAYALKCYPDSILDSRPRLKVEVMALELLDQYELTPRVINYDEDFNIALFDWIEGKSPELITESHISQLVHFIQTLKNDGEKHRTNLPLASEACLSAKELFTQVEKRIADLKTTNNLEVVDFLQNDLEPLWRKAKTWSTAQWPKGNFDTALPQSKQTLSPSDFGFHNTLDRGNGELCFLDLEYFGWDDPVKLIADFLWHPAMSLDPARKGQWINSAFALFQEDTELIRRFHAAWPVYGIRWALITLNIFGKRSITCEHLLGPNPPQDTQIMQNQRTQLNKADAICREITHQQWNCPYV